MEREPGAAGARRALGRRLEAVLASRSEANAVFDILAVLQSENQEEIQEAVRTCSRLFGALLERGELFVGQLPPEEMVMTGSRGAMRKYKVWMRHRYHSCCNRLGELLGHPSFQVKELALGTLMKLVQLEGVHPLEKPRWEGNYLFPQDLLKLVVGGLLSPEEDQSLLLSQFREYLDHDDVCYHTMRAAVDTVARVTGQHPEVPPAFWNNAFTLLSAVSLPRREPTVSSFYVKRAELSDTWKVAHLKEHRKAFQAMWLNFLKHKLPLSLYKKVLVIMHDAILPQLAQPTLMIDFLTRACDLGGALSLLALNGLFILIHEHNLEYPDFYRKLYGLLDPSVFHVKYRARFFRLADVFLSSSHLPAYLVAAFAKRLARLALTAPPEALLMVLPFICNLLRRHPACRVLVHRPHGPELDADPYDPGEEDPAQSRALESSLWELQALQRHYHPEVSKAASVINQALSVPEVSISPLLELTAYEIFERDLKKKGPEPVPLEFLPAQGLLGRPGDVCAQHFTLS
ncbi:nucleolar complex protein 4 homolog isoform X1 [Saimiri boliviensis]|uniref:nucleolar complex protein 4 homolog isoform X1 n=1 Tax=Saimiri boliviensis TaxID=27679 RepID=UPI00193E3E29|nr:nucleolar complex protein 4 homolog isoform X1 [Saimiri boliviensis boliviensis]XP_039327816.1 nucleolar complex protein 4 homolog isoform X1 [Saimiri boliviensis boliviensis]